MSCEIKPFFLIIIKGLILHWEGKAMLVNCDYNTDIPEILYYRGQFVINWINGGDRGKG